MICIFPQRDITGVGICDYLLGGVLAGWMYSLMAYVIIRWVAYWQDACTA